MAGRKQLFPPEAQDFIERNYRSMSDDELSDKLRTLFLLARSDSQIKRYRENNGFTRYPAKSMAEQKKAEENCKRITVCGAITTHRCF